MTDTRRRSAVRSAACARLAALAAAGILAAGIAPAAVATPGNGGPALRASAPAGGSPSTEAGGLVPTIHYEEALAHEHDRIEFEPGGRVTEGFRPRATDTFAVGGDAPRALPAGRATGTDMAASDQGSVWATRAAGGSVDQPIVDPGSVVDATSSGAWAPIQDGPVTVAGTGLRREVFGFLPYWEVADSSNVLNYDVLSTIAYFSVGADTSGNLLKQEGDGSTTTGWGGWTSSRLTTIINDAHARGTRVVLTISMFAWTDGQASRQASLLGNPAARLNLARQAAAAVRDRGADGINLDFEPIVSGYDDEFTALVQAFRQELDAIAPGYQLTFDTTGWIGNYPIEAATAPGGADAIFIMGYDYRGSSSSPVGSISPLTGPTYDLTDTVNAYTARVAPSKLILGVPYYGRAWSTDSDQPHANNISGTQYGSSVTAIYTTAADLAAQYGRRWDATDQAPWTAYTRETCTATYGCVTAWRQLWYDDAESLKLRYD
ncbi:MAG TPA: glycosyl hydrolase family 18 protein, partial [Actinoplanes sp.]|nr:glycosyl hydrolase family 18 protein [Actinoplanes sp.]